MKWGAIALLWMYCLVLIAPVLPYTAFKLNQEFITEQYCVNKDRPQLACNGQCYFMKQLQAADQQDQAANATAPPVVSFIPAYLATERHDFAISGVHKTGDSAEVPYAQKHAAQWKPNALTPPPRLS